MPMQPIGGPLQFDQGPLGPPLQAAPAKPKGGMFAGADWGSAIAAMLSGALASRGNPAGMAGLQMLNQRQRDKAEQAQYGQRREDEFSDWVRRQAWEIANKPQGQGAPHYFETNSGDQMMIGPDGKPQEVYHDPMRFKFVPNGMGGVVPVDISTLMSGQAPTAPVGKLTPIDEGGPTPQASGGFPRPY